MRQTLAALILAGIVMSAHAYPVVSSDPNTVNLNEWNIGLTQAKAKAKALNRPTLMVMLDTVTCSFSKNWVTRIADTSEWQAFIAANPMTLVFADKKLVGLSTLIGYARPFVDPATGSLPFPTVVLYRPDGTVADYFVARNTLGSSPGFYTRVRQTTDQYPYGGGTPPPATVAGTIGFSTAAASVSESAGSVTATVTRQSGSSGAQTFSYATEAGTAQPGVHFTAKSGTLSWGDGDASSKTITVSLINDGQYTSPTARTFALRLSRTSGTATLGTDALAVTINEATPNPSTSAPSFVAPTPASGSTVSVALNADVALQIQANGTAPVTYSASGLPSDLCIDESTGEISGTAGTAGAWPVTVTASNSKGSASISFTLSVVAKSAASAAGTYQAFFYEPDLQTVRGTLTLTAGATGSLRAKAVLDGATYTLTGSWEPGAFAAELSDRSGTTALTIEVDPSGILTGWLEDAALFGRRADPAGVSEFAGYYTAFLSPVESEPLNDTVNNQPEGNGFVTFTVNSRGAVRYSGTLADGTSFSGSSTLLTIGGTEMTELGYDGVGPEQRFAFFPVYTLLYSKRGVIAAQIWVDGSDNLGQSDNKVFAVGTEWLYPGKSASYPADGFVTKLDEGSFTEIGAAYVKPTNLAEAFGGARLQTECGDAALLPVGSSITAASGNDLRASLTASASTGLFSGRFLYTSEDGASSTVSFKGVLSPSMGLGAGFFVTPDKSVPGYTVKRSKAVLIAP